LAGLTVLDHLQVTSRSRL